MEKIVIGLIAEARSGKSTAAQYLVDRYKFKKLSIANPIKRIVQKLYNFSNEQTWGGKKEEIDPRWGFSPRKPMQDLGLYARQILGDDVWTKGMVKEALESDSDYFVVDDIRYLSDIRSLRHPNLKSYIVKLVYRDRESTDDGTHESESGISKIDVSEFDYILRHSKSEDAKELKDKLDLYMKSVGIL